MTEVLLILNINDSFKVMIPPDNLKLHSYLTLLSIDALELTVFQDVLNKYFNGGLEERKNK